MMATSEPGQHPKRHHYLPVAYLAGFTPSGNRNDVLHVFDLHRQTRWQARPSTVAYQNHLYTLDVSDEPASMEAKLAARESQIMPIIRTVCQRERFTADELDQLLSFMALTLPRLPIARRMMEAWVERKSSRPFEEALREPDAWQWLAEHRRQSLNEVVSEVKSYLSRGGDTRQLWHVRMIDPLQTLLGGLLRARIWSLCVAPHAHPFICSDNPIGVALPLDFASNEEPTLGHQSAILTFPLDRHVAVVAGIYDQPGVSHVSEPAVAEINAQTLRWLTRFAFSPSREFSFVLPDSTILWGEAILDLARSASGPHNDEGRP